MVAVEVRPRRIGRALAGNESVMLKELSTAFAIVVVCVFIHTGSIFVLALWLLRWRVKVQRQPNIVHDALLLGSIFLLTIVLHLVETAIWAVFYHQWGLFDDYETSLYFSLGSYTTIGYGDVVLPERWRLLGGMEGISGVLLCGLSTAFIFVVVTTLFQMRMKSPDKLLREFDARD
jgi:Ion channel